MESQSEEQPIKIHCTSRFSSEIRKLESSYKHYKSVTNDIYSFLAGKTINELFEQQQWIDNRPPDYRFIKCRIRNSGKGSGDSSGYRMYYIVLFNKKEVHLLFIHAKTGPEAINSLDRKFSKGLIASFSSEKMQGILRSVELNNSTKAIQIKSE